MKFKKQELLQLERCYAVNEADLNGERWILAASEGHCGCYAFDVQTRSQKHTVWEKPGGTMSFARIPGVENEFLAIQKFFRLYEWEEAEIVWVQCDQSFHFQVHTVLQEPYIHRFDVFETESGCYFLGCSLAAHKATREDWSEPGKILVGTINRTERTIERVRVLKADIHQNHGYWRQMEPDDAHGYIGCREGIFRVTPPTLTSDWKLEQIADFAVSDLAFADLDGDGIMEMATIEPFHGQYFRIYKQHGTAWEQVWEHPEVSEFYHAVWGGTLFDRQAFLSGCRRGKKQLCMITYDEGAYKMNVLDENVGPSNVHVLHLPETDVILSANREVGVLAAYTLVQEDTQ